jgi:drug/metabolite transporter (DMT)-like permease
MPGSLPLWTTLLAMLLLHEPITRGRAIGLACIVLGDVLVGGASLLKAFEGGEVWKGDLLFMTAAFCWSVYSVLVRKHGLNAVEATIAITAFGAVTFLPTYATAVLMDWVPSHLQVAPWPEMVFQAIYQGVGSVAISGITFNLMIRHYGPVRSTMITALVPGLSAMGAVAVLCEKLDLICGSAHCSPA